MTTPKVVSDYMRAMQARSAKSRWTGMTDAERSAAMKALRAKVAVSSNRLLDIRSKLISAGVKNLREFGYPKCDEKNILTDLIYKGFFVSMLRDNLGKGYDTDIKALLKECGEDV